jgi:predicted protein tyrosine phosphatase
MFIPYAAGLYQMDARVPAGGPGSPARVESRRGTDRVAREKILFVCTANLDRSRTAEDLYREDPRYEVRSAGTAAYAMTPLTRRLLLWADRVFVMSEGHDRHVSQIRLRFPGIHRRLVDLGIEDRWRRGDPVLVRKLLTRLEPHLGRPGADGNHG